MVFRRSNPNPGRGAFTLVELLVAVAVGSFVVTASVLFFILSVRSFTAMCNYVDLNDQSRNTTDVLSRDIRCAYSVDPTTTTNKLVLTYPGGTNVTYTYDSGLKTLTRTVGGKAQTMLKQVVGGTFAFFDKNSDTLAQLAEGSTITGGRVDVYEVYHDWLH